MFPVRLFNRPAAVENSTEAPFFASSCASAAADLHGIAYHRL